MSPRKPTSSNFPPDLAALLAPYWILLPLLLISSQLWAWLRAAAASGDFTLFWIAVGMGAIGSATLFFARLPLYRTKQFFRIGPRELDEAHRRLYFRAYILIAISVSLLTLLIYAIL